MPLEKKVLPQQRMGLPLTTLLEPSKPIYQPCCNFAFLYLFSSENNINGQLMLHNPDMHSSHRCCSKGKKLTILSKNLVFTYNI